MHLLLPFLPLLLGLQAPLPSGPSGPSGGVFVENAGIWRGDARYVARVPQGLVGAETAVPIPATAAGAKVHAQYAFLGTATCGDPLALATSHALDVTAQP